MSVWNSLIGLKARPLGRFTPSVFLQIRSATKKAAGSRTSMKDSAGRSLGPKKHEGQEVKPGEILMRQRGTKFYPGENVGIGKDHTIFALEPGYMRYYLDPFHPKRKFIGVALRSDLKLPTPHFAPRVRRFGRQIIGNPESAKKEENSLSRKHFLAKESLVNAMADRETRRAALLVQFAKILTETLQLNFEGATMDLATSYLLRLRSCLKNGYTLSDAQFNALFYLEQEAKLQAKREKWEQEKLNIRLGDIQGVAEKINTTTSFNNQLELIRYISSSERQEMKAKLIEELSKISLATKKDKKLVEKLFANAADFLELSLIHI